MAVYNKIVSVIVKIANAVCVASIAVMMFAVAANVFMRYVFGKPLSGVTELSECCWVSMALSFGYVVLINGHTQVDVFTEKMKLWPKRIINLITNICAFGFCGLVGWRTMVKAMSSKATNAMHVMLGVKEWIFIAVLAVSFMIAALAVVSLTVAEWKGQKNVIHERPPLDPLSEGGKNVK